MRDLPIPFSGSMVRAQLADLKTQTRRELQPKPEHLQVYDWKGKRLHDSEYRHWCWNGHVGTDNWDSISDQLRPFMRYQVGDRLYVREAWRVQEIFDNYAPVSSKKGAPIMQPDRCTVRYEADGKAEAFIGKLRQGMHMPRWASRLTLIVTDVRIERLQDISEADAIAEGITRENVIVGCHGSTGIHIEITADRYFYDGCDDEGFETAAEAYFSLWDSINGAGAADKNPWVVAYTFQVIKQNIDLIGREGKL